MSRWAEFFSRRERMMEDLDQEIRDFIERETQDNIARGVAPDEARYAALRKFGNVTQVKEETWEVWSFLWLEQFWQDFRYGIRMLAKNPGFTAVAVLTVALGIGANTAIFSVVNAELLRPLPYRDPGQLVRVATANARIHTVSGAVSYPDFSDWRAQNHVFQEMAGYVDSSFALTGIEQPAHLQAASVTASMFNLLGASPELGR